MNNTGTSNVSVEKVKFFHSLQFHLLTFSLIIALIPMLAMFAITIIQSQASVEDVVKANFSGH